MRTLERTKCVRAGIGLAGTVYLAFAVCAGMARAETIPDETILVGDFDGSGRVDAGDLGLLSGQWRRRLAYGPWEYMPPRLVAHWRLDGDAEDSVGGNDGALYGTPGWVSGRNAAVGNGAIALNGADCVVVADDAAFDIPGPITVAAWIRCSLPTGEATVISKGNGWRLAIGADGRLLFSCPGLEGDWQIVGQTNVADNQWHPVAGVYDRDAEQMLLYVDGEQDTSGTASGRIGLNDWDVWIGGNAELAGQWFDGLIDDVRLYNCVMTSQQIFNRTVWHVDAVNGRDTYNGQGRGRAFQTIQRGIDAAVDGDEVAVWPGVYTETVAFMGKAITLRSIADAAIIQSPGNFAVDFRYGEQAGSVLENFVIANSQIGIWVESSSPTIRNVTVVANTSGLEAYTGSRPVIRNCIFWGNTQSDIYNQYAFAYDLDVTYSCVERMAEGEGNISADPLFADAAGGDYHLVSERGRFVPDGRPGSPGPGPGTWVRDDETSPCIDAADPALNPMGESMPNGARVNMGAYGGMAQASRSPWPLACDVNHDGSVDVYDLRSLAENWLNDNQGLQE